MIRKQKKQRFGEFTVMFIPNEQETPMQMRVHLVPLLCMLGVLVAMTVGTVLMATQRFSPNVPGQSAGAEASLELVSAELASLARTSEIFSRTVNETVAQFGSQNDNSNSYMAGMDSIVLSDNPDDLPAIAAEFERARMSVENIERLYGLNEHLLRHIPNSWPLPRNRGIVTMEFGPNIHPFTRQVYLHKGFDIAEPRSGSPIMAVADGVIEKVATTFDYGQHIWVRHRFGFRSHYAHLSAFRVKEGDIVKQGQVIGNLGSTGLSTGPHLHLELWIENQLLDPAPFLAISNDFNRRTNRPAR
ncbi:MAG: M23 family metallopeptidase [Spirochaetaceae bacterium]|nr:MAG: M23 family metallopeptidase [Spirochaetaceae bacterium]